VKLQRILVSSSSVILGIFLNVIYLKSKGLDINAEFLVSHLKRKKTMVVSGKLGLKKIIHYLNNDIKWKYENLFKFKADVTRTLEGKVCSGLDECLLDEDIGGFVGTYLFDDIQKVKEISKIMTAIFGNEENLEIGENILLANWDNWSPED
jgi:hypothetical protein